MSLVHVCLSGSPACSGINPCMSCAQAIEQRVTVPALVAAGLNGSLLSLVHLFARTLHEIEQRHHIGADPAALAVSRVGVQLSSVFPSVDAQVKAYRDAQREAWGKMLHGVSGADPTLSAQAVKTPVEGAAVQPAAPSAEPTAATAAAAAAPAATAATTPATPASTTTYEAFVRQRKDKPQLPAEVAEPAITADDMAAAAVPAQPSAPEPNGAS